MSLVLLDTNVLVGTLSASRYSAAFQALRGLTSTGDEPCIVPQNLFEFWTAATRPVSSNGLGLSAAEAHSEVRFLLRTFRLLEEPAGLLEDWLGLCVDLDIKGRPAHDARLVAFMLGYGITRILTFERTRFSRFTQIEAVEL